MSRILQSDDNDLIWRQARFNWFAQILVRMGKDFPDPNETDKISNSIARKYINMEWIDREKLEEKGLTFVKETNLFFDKIHISQVCDFDKEKTVAFTKNINGIYDKDRRSMKK